MSKQRKQGPGSPGDLARGAGAVDPSDVGTGTYSHCLQLDQLDALERSIGVIAAHGDVLSIVDAAELATGTVAVIGEAIHEHARAIRGILDQVEAQPLRKHGVRRKVEEVRAGYAVVAQPSVTDMILFHAWPEGRRL